MKKKMFWNGLLAGSMILMMSAAAFAAETEMGTEEAGVQVIYLDEAGEQTDEASAAYMECAYLGEDGQIATVSFSDPSGELVVYPGTGYACVSFEYDENGLVCAERYFGADGERMSLENGVSGYFCVNGDGSLPVDLTWIDEEDQPVMNTELGYARVTREADEDGNVVLVSFFDADENPVVTAAGYATVARAFEDGNKIQEGYFGADGEPVVLPGKDYAGYFTEYDENGEKVATTYVDAEGNAVE